MWLYRALLHLYPSGFRAEYGHDMGHIFAQRLAAARWAVRILLWLEAVADTVWNAALAHLDLLRQDVRFALRSFRRSPGFALTAIAVAGLGIGATTAVFTVTDHVLVRPLPFPEPQRLVKLWEERPGYTFMEATPPNYLDWKRMSKSFAGMSAYMRQAANLTGQSTPRRVQGATATVDFFDVLGGEAQIGRVFTPEDGLESAPAVAVISHSLWQTAFAGDPEILGKAIELDHATRTIVGVMPSSFRFPRREVEYWTTLRFLANEPSADNRTDNSLEVVARLAKGASFDSAREEMEVIGAQLAAAYPVENANSSVNVIRLRDELSAETRTLLIALMAAAMCVLLVACLNLASLLLARSLARHKELAIRTSLGAGPERLVRQILTESLLLAAAGGSAGAAIAYGSLPLFHAIAAAPLPTGEPQIDLRVLAFAIFGSLASGIAFGVAPALRARGRATHGLGQDARASSGSVQQRVRSALVLSEVALSVVLLVSAGLLLQALARVQSVDPGFRADGVLTLRTALPLPKYDAVAQRADFYNRVLSEVRQLPGVDSAGYTSYLPIVMGGGIWPVSAGEEVHDRAASHSASLRYVTTGYLDALGIPLIEGREIRESDTQDAPFVAVVSQSLVDRHWPGRNPIGQRFRFGLSERTVVGVVADVRNRGLERASEPQVYLPHQQVPDGWLTFYSPKDLAVHATQDPAALLPALRRIIHDADPEQPVTAVQTMAEIVRDGSAERSSQLNILIAFGAVALLLAGIGIHGLLSFAVANRSREIGVRIAVGARPGHILALVVGEGARLAAAGVAVGVALAYAVGRAMESLLAGVPAADLATFSAVAALVLLVTLAGSTRPALRALAVDPNTAIRGD